MHTYPSTHDIYIHIDATHAQVLLLSVSVNTTWLAMHSPHSLLCMESHQLNRYGLDSQQTVEESLPHILHCESSLVCLQNCLLLYSGRSCFIYPNNHQSSETLDLFFLAVLAPS